jgi:hypothetical protein
VRATFLPMNTAAISDHVCADAFCCRYRSAVPHTHTSVVQKEVGGNLIGICGCTHASLRALLTRDTTSSRWCNEWPSHACMMVVHD